VDVSILLPGQYYLQMLGNKQVFTGHFIKF
jgi:hypothetical protein